LSKTEHKLLEKLYNQIILLSVFAVFAFGVIFLLLTLLPQFTELISFRFIGETLVTSGSIGVIVSLILGRRSEYVMRVKNLGLEEGQTLLQALNERCFRSAKYFYSQRDYEWEFLPGNEARWSAKVTDSISIRFIENYGKLTFVREADEKLTDKLESIPLWDLTEGGPPIHLQPEIMLDFSVPNKRFFKLTYNFLANHEYKVVIGYEYPPSMNKNYDYIHMMNPVLTERSKISLKIPNDFNFNKYHIDCYVINNSYDEARNLDKSFDPKKFKLTVRETGPFQEGETIILKYKLK
jgi:hypothetical protein